MGKRVYLGLAVLAIAAGVAGIALSRSTPPLGAGDRLAESLLSPGPLHDKHLKVACTDCHQPFRGVKSDRCATGDCHPQSKLAQAKPAVVAVHDKNADLSCLACHTDHRGRTASLTTLAFHRQASRDTQQDCADCHLDAGRRAHAGIRSTDCAACHTSTARWSEVSFSHSQVTGEPCASCHRAPGGWLHASAGGVSCGACHSTRAWEPSTFRHPRIPEFGEHMEEVGCRDCHPTSLKQARPCEACHRGGRFED